MGTLLESPRSLWHCIRLGEHVNTMTLSYLSKGAIIPWWSPVTSGASISRTRKNRDWVELHIRKHQARKSKDQHWLVRKKSELKIMGGELHSSAMKGPRTCMPSALAFVWGWGNTENIWVYHYNRDRWGSFRQEQEPECQGSEEREGCLLSFVRDHAVSLEPEPLQDKIHLVMGEAFPGKATSLLWSYLATEARPKKLWGGVRF